MPPITPRPTPRNSACRTSVFCTKLASCNSPSELPRRPRKCMCLSSTRASRRSLAILIALAKSGSTTYKRLLMSASSLQDSCVRYTGLFEVCQLHVDLRPPNLRGSVPSEEHASQAKGVAAFRGHECHEHQQRPGRQQDGVDQCQPLPAHVHEHRDDEAGLEQHEDDDEGPAQQAMQVEVVDRVRHAA